MKTLERFDKVRLLKKKSVALDVRKTTKSLGRSLTSLGVWHCLLYSCFQLFPSLKKKKNFLISFLATPMACESS